MARVDRTSATVALGEPAPAHEPALHLELLVPTCRPERASWLIEKATEVGVAGIRFLNMARAPRDIGSGIFDRLRRVAVSAVEQCHRSRLPEITGPHEWRDLPVTAFELRPCGHDDALLGTPTDARTARGAEAAVLTLSLDGDPAQFERALDLLLQSPRSVLTTATRSEAFIDDRIFRDLRENTATLRARVQAGAQAPQGLASR